MTDQTESQAEDRTTQAGHAAAGIELSGDRVEVGRDVVGRDVVTTIAGGDVVTTTSTGFSAEAVQRLLITVGLLVFMTAACFFSGGLLLGGAVFTALARPVQSSPEAAQEMSRKLTALSQLPPGQPFVLTFTEDQISSYVRFIAGPAAGLSDGRVRFLDEPGALVVGGRWAGAAHLPVAVTFELRAGDTPLVATGAAVRIFQSDNPRVGWVWVPAILVKPLERWANDWIFGQARLRAVAAETGLLQPAWRVSGVAR